MTIPGSYNASTYHRNLDSELQRLRAQVELTWKKESRTLQWLGLQDGMSVLELGSGPGFSTEKLLTLLPTSNITSVEVDPVMVQQTRQRIQSQQVERFTLVEASAANTGLPNNLYGLCDRPPVVPTFT